MNKKISKMFYSFSNYNAIKILYAMIFVKHANRTHWHDTYLIFPSQLVIFFGITDGQ